MKEYHQRVANLRVLLKKSKLAGFIQPVNDRFQNEYIPECWRRVPYISGFTGSAGYVVILEKKAAAFVDGRYTLQAKNEVDKSLFSVFNSAEKIPAEWIVENLKSGKMGFDSTVITKAQAERYKATLSASNIEFVDTKNLIDEVWKGRPPEPNCKAIVHDIKFSGRTLEDKLKEIGGKIKSATADYHIVTAPDSLCWLFNIRGSDVPNTPFILTYAIVGKNGKAKIFLDKNQCGKELLNHFGKNVSVEAKGNLEKELKKIAKSKSGIMLDAESSPLWFFDFVAKNGGRIVNTPDPCTMPKACKNPVEIKGIKEAHKRDGASLAKFLKWIKEESAKRPIGEIEASEKLFSFRKTNKNFIGPSFDTISGFAANGAIVHYHASKATEKKIHGNGVYLVDSGGQYFDGTTDVTRTVAIGKPTREQKQNFTLVLKGHIALATITFPEGTTGPQLDTLARQFLWQQGLDYDHGTGHGVGYFLSVHEGPQRISKGHNAIALRPGMVISNEPGYYKAGEYGIRIENLVLVVEKGKMENGRKLLGFETLTCAPIDGDMIDSSLLTKQEVDWLKKYNAKSA